MKKKKIILFSSTGGGGHVATSKALEEYLNDIYDVKTVHVLETVLFSIDYLSKFTFGMFKGEQLYNFLIRKKLFRTINLFYNLGLWYFSKRKKRVQELIYNYLKKENADLAISVMPLVNGSILHAAQQLNIPFLLIPTDLDTRAFLHDINYPTYEKFYFTLPYNDKIIVQLALDSGIPEKCITITGFPIGADFFTKKNKTILKNEFGIEQHKHVVLVMMGAQGSHITLEFTNQLLKTEHPIHIINCVGKSYYLKRKLRKLKLPPHISMSTMGYTQRTADLMAIANIFISKSGGVSVAESLYSSLPMLLDHTSALLRWEEFNLEFVKRHQFGFTINKAQDIPELMEKLLSNGSELETIKKRIADFPKKNGGLEIRELIKKIFS